MDRHLNLIVCEKKDRHSLASKCLSFHIQIPSELNVDKNKCLSFIRLLYKPF